MRKLSQKFGEMEGALTEARAAAEILYHLVKDNQIKDKADSAVPPKKWRGKEQKVVD